jgi:hypothetical protein
MRSCLGDGSNEAMLQMHCCRDLIMGKKGYSMLKCWWLMIVSMLACLQCMITGLASCQTEGWNWHSDVTCMGPGLALQDESFCLVQPGNWLLKWLPSDDIALADTSRTRIRTGILKPAVQRHPHRQRVAAHQELLEHAVVGDDAVVHNDELVRWV